MAEIMGTAFLVHGTWYLRHLHGGGVMVPIEGVATAIASLEDGRMVRLIGNLSSDGHGCPRAVHVTEIELLG